MTRKYFHNNKEILKAEWETLYMKHKDSRVILRTDTLPATPERKQSGNAISPERAKELRKAYTIDKLDKKA